LPPGKAGNNRVFPLSTHLLPRLGFVGPSFSLEPRNPPAIKKGGPRDPPLHCFIAFIFSAMKAKTLFNY